MKTLENAVKRSRQASDEPEERSEVEKYQDSYIAYTITFSVLAQIAKLRRWSNRNMNILITSKGFSRGLGKTTLAVYLANVLEGNPPWRPEDKAVIGEFWKHKRQHKTNPPWSWLLFDELEHAVDRRNPMSKANRELRQVLSKYRDMGISKIYTSPSISLIDRDVLAFFDMWINVTRQGFALQWYLSVPDTGRNAGKLQRYKITNPYTGNDEMIRFPDISDYRFRKTGLSRDIAYLDMKKHQMINEENELGEDLIKREELEEREKELKNEMEEERRMTRDGLLALVAHNCKCTKQNEWAKKVTDADLDGIDDIEIDASRISQIKSEV